MERIQTLINRLQEQVRQNADVSQMQMTLQLLQSELNQLQKTSVRTLGTSKVSVVLPTRVAITPVSVAKKEVEEEQEVISVPKIKSKPKSQLDLHFDPMNEIPTFSQYKIGKEVNEAVEQKESFNDRLKENRN